MEIDIYLPKYSLAFEYQGEHHFAIPSFLRNEKIMEDIKKKDEEKIESCRKEQITLIIIPFWWKKNKNDLIATIHHFNPKIILPNKKNNSGNLITIDKNEGKE